MNKKRFFAVKTAIVAMLAVALTIGCFAGFAFAATPWEETSADARELKRARDDFNALQEQEAIAAEILGDAQAQFKDARNLYSSLYDETLAELADDEEHQAAYEMLAGITLADVLNSEDPASLFAAIDVDLDALKDAAVEVKTANDAKAEAEANLNAAGQALAEAHSYLTELLESLKMKYPPVPDIYITNNIYVSGSSENIVVYGGGNPELLQYIQIDGVSVSYVVNDGVEIEGTNFDNLDVGEHEIALYYHPIFMSLYGGGENIRCVYLQVIKTGWQEIDGSWYYLDETGTAVTGWQKIDGGWYYFSDAGIMQTEWQKISKKWYYLGADGVMRTGWVKSGNSWYYMKSSGVMATDWQQIDGAWYYLGTDGAMRAGWQQVGGSWYYFGGNGILRTGWQKIGGKWYYMNTEGVMQYGWLKIGSKWYYLNSSGVMTTGWQKISGNWYYMNSAGVMVKGTQTIDGKVYHFSNSGVWIK